MEIQVTAHTRRNIGGKIEDMHHAINYRKGSVIELITQIEGLLGDEILPLDEIIIKVAK
jgi:hypothetical protein